MSVDGKLEARRNNGNGEVRVYRLCSFTPGAVVPRVELLGATCDEEALHLASTIECTAERELWDQYRLVACLAAHPYVAPRQLEDADFD